MSETPPIPAAGPSAPGAGLVVEPIRVLVVDDHALFRRGLQMVLEQEPDIEVVAEASDGAEAVVEASEETPDIVLMDVRMPKLDGLEAARLYRARGGKTPIVALTANAFEEDRRECRDAGMDDFLPKPLDAGSLRAVVARWTEPATRAKVAS